MFFNSIIFKLFLVIIKTKYLLPAVIARLLIGCGTVSQVNKEGRTAEPVFPELTKLIFQEGTWPNLDNQR